MTDTLFNPSSDGLESSTQVQLWHREYILVEGHDSRGDAAHVLDYLDEYLPPIDVIRDGFVLGFDRSAYYGKALDAVRDHGTTDIHITGIRVGFIPVGCPIDSDSLSRDLILRLCAENDLLRFSFA